jgi:hypothetical protein
MMCDFYKFPVCTPIKKRPGCKNIACTEIPQTFSQKLLPYPQEEIINAAILNVTPDMLSCVQKEYR